MGVEAWVMGSKQFLRPRGVSETTCRHLATLPSHVHSALSLVCPQVLRQYSNIEEDATICPPWCLTVRLRAHTFEAEREHFIPQYVLDVPKVRGWLMYLKEGGFCRDAQCLPLNFSPCASLHKPKT